MHTLFEEMNNPCHFVAKIAGVAVEIKTQYPSTYSFCGDYLTDEEPVIHVSTTNEDIQREIRKGNVNYFYSLKEFNGPKNNQDATREINESIIEPAIIYRKVIEELLAYNMIFVHGAVVAERGRAFMFTAQSGTGKTTHIKKWIHAGKQAYILNGDKPLIRFSETGIDACGTPWCGKENYGTNSIVPLKAIILMERDTVNRMEEISFSQAYAFLLRQTFLPDDAEKAKKTLKLLMKFNGKMRFFRFLFNNFSDDCFDISYNTLAGIE